MYRVASVVSSCRSDNIEGDVPPSQENDKTNEVLDVPEKEQSEQLSRSQQKKRRKFEKLKQHWEEKKRIKKQQKKEKAKNQAKQPVQGHVV